jgi:hypothetical protein
MTHDLAINYFTTNQTHCITDHLFTHQYEDDTVMSECTAWL